MTAAGPESPSWEELLASFEATAQRCELLLRALSEAAADRSADLAGYDVSRLKMPLLPDDLVARADAIRTRQAALTELLQATMIGVRRQAQLTAEAAPPAQRTAVVDRRA